MTDLRKYIIERFRPVKEFLIKVYENTADQDFRRSMDAFGTDYRNHEGFISDIAYTVGAHVIANPEVEDLFGISEFGAAESAMDPFIYAYLCCFFRPDQIHILIETATSCYVVDQILSYYWNSQFGPYEAAITEAAEGLIDHYGLKEGELLSGTMMSDGYIYGDSDDSSGGFVAVTIDSDDSELVSAVLDSLGFEETADPGQYYRFTLEDYEGNYLCETWIDTEAIHWNRLIDLYGCKRADVSVPALRVINLISDKMDYPMNRSEQLIAYVRDHCCTERQVLI